MAQSLLQGLKVLEYTHMVAGPLAGRRLGDMGADVIKIEPRGGDRSRFTLGVDADGIDGDHLRFHFLNGGKRSIELDFKQDADREVAVRLASQADVFIQNFRTGALARYGLGYEQLKVVNPALVYASVTGFGPGPWADDPGQDLLAQARSGLAWRTGARESPPFPTGSYITDIMAGALLVQGILAAVVHSRQTGQGAHVETSLMEAALELQVDTFPMVFNRTEPLMGRSRSGVGGNPEIAAPYGVYATADGHLAVSYLPPEAMADMLGDSAPDPEATLGPEQARDLLLESLALVFRRLPTADWIQRLQPLGAWIVEVLDWRQLAASEGFTGLEIMASEPTHRGAKVMLSPLRIDGERSSPAAAPRLNEHDDEVRQRGWR